MSSDKLLQDIENFKNTYYSENKKNVFFKKAQKMEIASQISDKFSLEELIQKTVFIIPGTNRVFVDYVVFKLYATPENYKTIVERVIMCFNAVIQEWDTFECHLNLDSFTISAAERYKLAIELFCKDCLKSETRYGRLLNKMYIYNSPGMVERFTSIFTHLIDPYVRDKFILYGKDDSDKRIEEVVRG